MLTGYAFAAIMVLVAVGLPASMLVLPWMLTKVGIKPHRPDKIKNATYECGLPTLGGSWAKFNFRYYNFALLFVVFDVTVVFLFPWAARIRTLAWSGLIAMAVFMAILAVGLAYAWRKKALEWK